MQHWTSREPLAVPADVGRIALAHLELAGVRLDGPSFVLLVFLAPEGEALPADAGRDHPRFAAARSVFSSGDCWGDEGHCDWKRGPVSAFDRRPQHHRTPVTLTLDVTRALKALGNPDRVQVAIRATRTSDREADDVLRFARLSLHAYTAGADAPDGVVTGAAPAPAAG
jgi:hypothetical protein